MKYKIIERAAFQVIGVKREYPMVDGGNMGISTFWNEVNKNGIVDLLFQLNNGQMKSVLGVVADSDLKNMMEYWIATEFSGDDVPEGLSVLDIPASRWAVFEVNGPMPDAMQESWKQIYSEWFPASGYQQAGPSLEVYNDNNTTDPNFYSEIWISVK